MEANGSVIRITITQTHLMPIGLHKHFRIIAISEYLKNHGYNPEVDTHTRIPGIWAKLGREYNLEAIDERELPATDVPDDEIADFRLRGDEFDIMMFEKGRRASGSETSTPSQSRASSAQPSRKRQRGASSRKRASTIDDTDDTQATPPSSSPIKATRATRAAAQAHKDSDTRQTSKEPTADEDEEDGDEDDEDQVEEETPEPSTSKSGKSEIRGKAASSKTPAARKSRRKR